MDTPEGQSATILMANSTRIEAKPLTHALLPTAKVKLKTATGMTECIRAICDTGAQMNLRTLACTKRLNLALQPTDLMIHGIGGTNITQISGVVSGQLYDRHEQWVGEEAHFVVMPELTDDMPDWPVKIELVDQINDYFGAEELADDEFWKPAAIDAIIGAGTFAALLVSDIHKVKETEYRAQCTTIGYIIMGYVERPMRHVCLAANLVTNEQLNENILKLWQLEKVDDTADWTAEDQWCEKQFEEYHRRDNVGRYIVQFPIRQENIAKLGNSKEIVRRLFHRMERRMAKDEELRKKYVAFMQAYEEDGHMQKAVVIPNRVGVNYISHHSLPPDRKFRVVFHGSLATASGCSFNDIQLTGPRLQKELFELIVQFRIGQYAMTADIVKMFRQIRIAEEHCDLQRIFWRESPTDELQEYQLTVVTYGFKSSPYLAVKALQQCGIDEGNDYPLAKKEILGWFYMDDYLSSFKKLYWLERR